MLDRNLESQKEKLETDLKREIKKLQKNRELIKNWQLNDTVEVVVTRNKLQEYRRLVEEAMEKYKEVEKSSKMKSFSNQSIMLASLEESQHLSQEAIEVINFIDESRQELDQQIENLESEYEKISGKKTKKNSAVESEKQEIENFLSKDRFHLESFERIIDFIKNKQINPELVVKIKDDITFFLESNQEPDFIDDETLYDEIFQQAESNYTYVPKESQNTLQELVESNSQEANGHVSTNGATAVSNSSSASSTNNNTNNTATGSNKRSQSRTKSPTPNTPTKKSHEAVTPVKVRQSTPDIDIVQRLKPAATPSKVTGEVAWSSVAGVNAAVAGAGAPSSAESDKATIVTNLNATNDSTTSLESEIPDNSRIEKAILENIPLVNNVPVDDPNYAYSKVLEFSGLAPIEFKLFTDSELTRVPPGIQHLVLSFNASRNIKLENDSNDTNSQGKLLFNGPAINSLATPMLKPYLPKGIQNSFYQYNGNTKESYIRPPLHLMNYQGYWNRIRFNGSYDDLVNDIKGLIEQLHQSVQLNPAIQPNMNIINELVMVLFYGFYYGLTPLENMIAENKLIMLGWKPYTVKTANQFIKASLPNNSGLNPDKYHYWIRNLSHKIGEVPDESEVADYQIFDLNTWDIHIKLGFKLDSSLAESNPMTVVA